MNVRALIACAALIVAAAAAALYAEGRERAQQAVLSTELADFIVPANVDRRDAAALRAAYAAALARLDPLFGRSGTDPDKLGESTAALATYISRIASLYDRKERDIITRVWHPLSFLKGMAETERARQELIITPSLPPMSMPRSSRKNSVRIHPFRHIPLPSSAAGALPSCMRRRSRTIGAI